MGENFFLHSLSNRLLLSLLTAIIPMYSVLTRTLCLLRINDVLCSSNLIHSYAEAYTFTLMVFILFMLFIIFSFSTRLLQMDLNNMASLACSIYILIKSSFDLFNFSLVSNNSDKIKEMCGV